MINAQTYSNQFTDAYGCSNFETNNVFSGYSFLCLLELLSKGATGDILKEITNIIQKHKFLSMIIQNYSVKMNNLLCHNETMSLTPYYMECSRNENIIIEKVNMKELQRSIHQINIRIAQFTNNLIPFALNANDYDETFIFTLMNIINFEGEWEKKFPIELTTDEKFTIMHDDKQLGSSVMMMKQFGEYYQYYEDEINQYILMPCVNSFYSMFVCLPKKISSSIKFPPTDQILSKMMHKKINKFYLPRFEIETSFDMKKLCEKLGICTMFTQSDQLKKIIDDNTLMLSSIIQKCAIKVNEEGAKAAVVTFAEVMAGCCPPSFIKEKEIDFIANHPFGFQVIDMRQILVLFTGVFYNKNL